MARRVQTSNAVAVGPPARASHVSNTLRRSYMNTLHANARRAHRTGHAARALPLNLERAALRLLVSYALQEGQPQEIDALADRAAGAAAAASPSASRAAGHTAGRCTARARRASAASMRRGARTSVDDRAAAPRQPTTRRDERSDSRPPLHVRPGDTDVSLTSSHAFIGAAGFVPPPDHGRPRERVAAARTVSTELLGEDRFLLSPAPAGPIIERGKGPTLRCALLKLATHCPRVHVCRDI